MLELVVISLLGALVADYQGEHQLKLPLKLQEFPFLARMRKADEIWTGAGARRRSPKSKTEEDFGDIYGIVSPYVGVVREVEEELDRVLGPGRYSRTEGFNAKMGGAEFRFGGPAPTLPKIRQAVRSVLERHGHDPHTLIYESQLSPGAIGTGSFVALVEQPAVDHVH